MTWEAAGVMALLASPFVMLALTIWNTVRPRRPRQTTWAYCPRCQKDLVSSHSYSGETIDYLSGFKCATCFLWSEWDFHAPVPILISQRELSGYPAYKPRTTQSGPQLEKEKE